MNVYIYIHTQGIYIYIYKVYIYTQGIHIYIYIMDSAAQLLASMFHNILTTKFSATTKRKRQSITCSKSAFTQWHGIYKNL